MVAAIVGVVAFVGGAVTGWVVKARVLAAAARVEAKFDAVKDAIKS